MVEFDTIKIESALAPLSLLLHPQEFETRYPSFRCQVSCIVSHPTGRFIYKASDIWFSTNDFDRFIFELDGITRGTLEQARLHDLSDYVIFIITQCGRKTSVSWSASEPSPDSAEARLSFTGNVDAGFPAAVLASLREYERWW